MAAWLCMLGLWPALAGAAAGRDTNAALTLSAELRFDARVFDYL